MNRRDRNKKRGFDGWRSGSGSGSVGGGSGGGSGGS